jgi:chemotaxis protein methyltransferase CheR
MKTTDEIAKIIRQSTTLDLTTYDSTFVNNMIKKRMKDVSCQSKEEYILFLKNNSEENDYFIDSMQVSYSEFFRNSLTYSVLQKIIIPGIFLKKSDSIQNEIRVWSAACASGQEAYSLAILLNEFKPDKKVKFRIFATDQSEKQIEKAKEGIYSVSALDSLNLKQLNTWFEQHEQTYAVKPTLKENIEFSTFDLLNKQHYCPPSSIFGDFDIIFCANILFYYKPEFRNIIIDKLSKCLSKNGLLVTGETEREVFFQHHYLEVYPNSCIFKK